VNQSGKYLVTGSEQKQVATAPMAEAGVVIYPGPRQTIQGHHKVGLDEIDEGIEFISRCTAA